MTTAPDIVLPIEDHYGFVTAGLKHRAAQRERRQGASRIVAEIDRLRAEGRAIRKHIAIADVPAPQPHQPRTSTVKGPALADVVATVLEVTGVTEYEFHGPKRSKRFSNARHLAYGLLRELRTDLSYVVVGKAFRRDHTSIMHGVARFKALQFAEPFASWIADPRIVALRHGAGQAVM